MRRTVSSYSRCSIDSKVDELAWSERAARYREGQKEGALGKGKSKK
jgi:hypothetical protein